MHESENEVPQVESIPGTRYKRVENMPAISILPNMMITNN